MQGEIFLFDQTFYFLDKQILAKKKTNFCVKLFFNPENRFSFKFILLNDNRANLYIEKASKQKMIYLLTWFSKNSQFAVFLNKP